MNNTGDWLEPYENLPFLQTGTGVTARVSLTSLLSLHGEQVRPARGAWAPHLPSTSLPASPGNLPCRNRSRGKTGEAKLTFRGVPRVPLLPGGVPEVTLELCQNAFSSPFCSLWNVKILRS